MKTLNVLPLIAVLLFCNMVTLQAMYVPIEQYVFLKTTIGDIQNLAKDLSHNTGYKYQIVENSAIVERCLQTLGLNANNTPLDIRYHYDLLIQKLSNNDQLCNTIKKVYNQLMTMLFVFDDYQTELQDLLEMNFEQVEAMELENVPVKYDFLKYKDRIINNTIKSLKENQRQYLFKKQFESITAIQDFFHLPVNASYHSIKEHYDNYMEKNSPHQLIALKKIKAISGQNLKKKMFEIEKVKEAYMKYLQGR